MILFAFIAALGALASDVVAPPSTAVSTATFKLSTPSIGSSDDGVKVSGSVCRRAYHSLISPTHIEIDRIDLTGAVIDKKYAYVAALSRRPDQSCAHYSTTFATPLLPSETIVVCIPQHGRICQIPKGVTAKHIRD